MITSTVSLVRRITEVAQRASSRPFLRLLDADGIATELSYLGLLQQAGLWANIYRKRGLTARQRVVIFLPHSADCYAAFVGALLADLVPAMLPPPSPKLSGPRFAATIAPVLPATHSHAAVIGAELRDGLTVQPDLKIIFTADALSESLPSLDSIPFAMSGREGDPAFIQYSSGTTGIRKGVSISHGACLRQVELYGSAIALGDADSIVSWLPLYHDMGLIACLMLPLLTGTPVTAMSPFDWIMRPSMLIRAVRDYRPSLCWLPNFAFSHLARSVPAGDVTDGDLASLRAIVNCSEPIRHGAQEAFLSRFNGAGIEGHQLGACYAMAEATFAITSSRPGVAPTILGVDPMTLGVGSIVKPGHARLVSSGLPIAGTSVRVVSEVGITLPDRTIGHIRVRGQTMAAGYLGDGDATRAAFIGDELHTGDIGFLADGELFVLGRADDTIIIAGRNLYPQDVEAIAESIPGIVPGRSVAFGVLDENDGTNALVVVAEAERGQDRAELQKRIATELVLQLDVSPRVVRAVDRGWLVKSTSGKVSRASNRERYLAELAPTQESRVGKPDTHSPLIEFVRACVSAALGRVSPGDDESLIMSGALDSLALTALLLELGERYGDRLPMPNIIGFDRFDSIAAIHEMLEEVDLGLTAPAPGASAAAREIKIRAISRTTAPLDLLILGSSTSFPLSSDGTSSHLSGFNFSVNGATVADLYCLFRLAQDRRQAIQRVIVGLDVFAFRGNGEIVLDLLTPTLPEILKYLDADDRAAMERLHDSAIRTSQHHRINLQRLAQWDPGVSYSFHPPTGDLILDTLRGQAHRMQNLDQMKHEAVLAYGPFYRLCEKQSAYLHKMVAAGREGGIRMDLVLLPPNPALHGFLAKETPYFDRRVNILEMMKAAESSTVTAHDTMAPGAPDCDPTDFSDLHHFGAKNAAMVLHLVFEGSDKGQPGVPSTC